MEKKRNPVNNGKIKVNTNYKMLDNLVSEAAILLVSDGDRDLWPPERSNEWVCLRTFALIVSAHPYCARKSTCHAMPRHASSARAKY